MGKLIWVVLFAIAGTGYVVFKRTRIATQKFSQGKLIEKLKRRELAPTIVAERLDIPTKLTGVASLATKPSLPEFKKHQSSVAARSCILHSSASNNSLFSRN